MESPTGMWSSLRTSVAWPVNVCNRSIQVTHIILQQELQVSHILVISLFTTTPETFTVLFLCVLRVFYNQPTLRSCLLESSHSLMVLPADSRWLSEQRHRLYTPPLSAFHLLKLKYNMAYQQGVQRKPNTIYLR